MTNSVQSGRRHSFTSPQKIRGLRGDRWERRSPQIDGIHQPCVGSGPGPNGRKSHISVDRDQRPFLPPHSIPQLPPLESHRAVRSASSSTLMAFLLPTGCRAPRHNRSRADETTRSSDFFSRSRLRDKTGSNCPMSVRSDKSSGPRLPSSPEPVRGPCFVKNAEIIDVHSYNRSWQGADASKDCGSTALQPPPHPRGSGHQ